jgi:hypothetical protein
LKKIFSILFAVYFISLLVAPCGDKENCNEYAQQQTSGSKHQQGHSDEACTPFCFCSCCATYFLINDFQPVSTLVVEINSVYTQPKDFKTSTPIMPIWQPPKIA